MKQKLQIRHLKDKEAITCQFSRHFKRIFWGKWRSDQKFLEASGYHRKELHRFKDGKGNPTLYSIITMANAIGVHPKEFFDITFHNETATYKANYYPIQKELLEEFEKFKQQVEERSQKAK